MNTKLAIMLVSIFTVCQTANAGHFRDALHDVGHGVKDVVHGVLDGVGSAARGTGYLVGEVARGTGYLVGDVAVGTGYIVGGATHDVGGYYGEFVYDLYPVEYVSEWVVTHPAPRPYLASCQAFSNTRRGTVFYQADHPSPRVAQRAALQHCLSYHQSCVATGCWLN